MYKQVINLLWTYLYYVLNYLVFLKAGFILRRVILKFRILESLFERQSMIDILHWLLVLCSGCEMYHLLII